MVNGNTELSGRVNKQNTYVQDQQDAAGKG